MLLELDRRLQDIHGDKGQTNKEQGLYTREVFHNPHVPHVSSFGVATWGPLFYIV